MAQLIVTCMGANIIFHRDKKGEHSEFKFHSAFFRLNTLIEAFSNLLNEETDEFKGARQFHRSALEGLWYKHVEDATISGLAKNIIMSNKRNDWLIQRCIEEFGEFDPTKIDEIKLNKFIRNQMLNKGLERRKNKSRMTGEWLIFEKKNDKIHFLTLASHQEDENRILARIRGERFCPAASATQ